MRLRWSRLAAVSTGVIVVTVALGPRLATAIEPAAYDDEPVLVAALWEQSPEVIDARAQAATAASELRKARTLPNPQLDFTWGTIPIGKTNPPDLPDPLGNVPNYSV